MTTHRYTVTVIHNPTARSAVGKRRTRYHRLAGLTHADIRRYYRASERFWQTVKANGGTLWRITRQ